LSTIDISSTVQKAKKWAGLIREKRIRYYVLKRLKELSTIT
jgi:hypothetical protein